MSDNSSFVVTAGIVALYFLFSSLIDSANAEKMAKSGLQQCRDREGSMVLWQKECSK